MNIKRAIATGILLYLSSFIVFGFVRFIGGADATSYSVSLRWYLVFWLVYIPLTLGWAKWHFRKDTPTVRTGFLLGIIAILVAFAIDGIFILGTIAAGESTEIFKALYMDWKFVVSVVWVILLCAFAGWEFDTTYTAPKK